MKNKGEPLTQEQKNELTRKGIIEYWKDPTRSGEHRLKCQQGMLKFWNKIKGDLNTAKK